MDARELKEEGRTQAEIASDLGVAQNTISGWLRISNIKSDNANMDSRVTLPKAVRTVLLERAELKRGGPVSGSISESRLRRGQAAAGGRSAIKWVPLFVAQQSVRIPKKIDVIGVVERARAALPGYFARFLKDDEG